MSCPLCGRVATPERLDGERMLEELDLSGIPCFGSGSPTLEPLAGLTLLYGPNGSGKSSIANRLEQRKDPNSLLLLYDQGYIDDLLAEDTTIEGVFTIRDADKETQRRLKQILGTGDGKDGKSGELPKLRDKVDSKTRTLEKKQDEVAQAKAELAEQLWDERNGLPEELRFAFKGTGGSRKVLEKRTQEYRSGLGEDSKPKSEEALVFDAKTLEAPVPESSGLLPAVPEIPDLSQQAEVLLREPITGKEETSFSEFVDKLGNRDWVAAGRAPFSRAGGKCPFCQQEAPADLQSLLDSLFDAHYEEQVDQVRALLKGEKQALNAFEQLEQVVKGVGPENEKEIIRTLELLKATLKARVSSLEKKVDNPSVAVTLESLGDHRADLVALFKSGNQEADRTARLLANRASARQTLITDIWTYFVTEVAAEALAKYEGAADAPRKAIAGLERSLAVLRPKLRELEDEAEKLREKLTSPRPTVRKINKLLRDLGFLSFEIQDRDDETYQLVRPDGAAVKDTLSEGERTLISFLYFYFRALQESVDRTDGAKVTIVLDDPVSSLDSESLFVISLLTRDLFDKQIDQSTSLSQVFLMTHNAYFYKEAVYVPHGQKEGNRSYLVLSKGGDGVSSVQHYSSNPIESTYALLWVEVQKAAEVPGGIASVALPNSMRRILENYFKIMGGTKVEDLLKEASPDKNWDQWALLSWVNDGSHSAPWDVGFAGMQITNKALLNAFEGIFIDTGHGAHYEMMMREADRVVDSQ